SFAHYRRLAASISLSISRSHFLIPLAVHLSSSHFSLSLLPPHHHHQCIASNSVCAYVHVQQLPPLHQCVCKAFYQFAVNYLNSLCNTVSEQRLLKKKYTDQQ